MELMAILEGTNIAKELRKGRTDWSAVKNLDVTIFTDSENSLEFISKGQNLQNHDLHWAVLQPMIGEIIYNSHRLTELGCNLKLAWIPGHKHSVEPHKIADKESRKSGKVTGAT